MSRNHVFDNLKLEVLVSGVAVIMCFCDNTYITCSQLFRSEKMPALHQTYFPCVLYFYLQ